MANEPLPALRGEVRALAETTYATDAGVAATDVRYVENWDSNAKPTLEQRPGISPFRAGWRNRLVGQANTWSSEVEITALTVPASDTLTPEIDPWLAACGFGAKAFSAVGDPNTITYALLSHGHRSATIQERFFNPAQSDGIGREYLGARCDWTITIDGQGIWRLAMDGAAKTGTAILGPSATTLTYGFENGPVIGSQTTATLVSLEGNGDSTYGTGSLLATVVSATVTGNMNLQVQTGLSGTVGPSRVVLNPEQGVGVELVLEQQVDAEWDPFTWMLDQTGADNVYSLILTATVGVDTVNLGTFYISGMEIENVPNEGGRRLWRINHSGVYPEVGGTDGGGLVPANNFSLFYSTPD